MPETPYLSVAMDGCTAGTGRTVGGVRAAVGVLLVLLLAGCGGEAPGAVATSGGTGAGRTGVTVSAVGPSAGGTPPAEGATAATGEEEPATSPLAEAHPEDEPTDATRTLSTSTPYALDPCERPVRLQRREHVLTSTWRADGHTHVRQVALLDTVGGGASEYAWLLSGLRSCVAAPPEALWDEDRVAYIRQKSEWDISLGWDDEAPDDIDAFAGIVPGPGASSDLHFVMRRGRVVTVATVRTLEERPHGGLGSDDGDLVLEDTLGPRLKPMIEAMHPLLFELAGDEVPQLWPDDPEDAPTDQDTGAGDQAGLA
ncbi:hypothetical protein [Aquipuribacter sp. SD81]|uniref:hypothetical protein n=1 Tax=Aquipuribacter sp. SD81 TaxID=3127703 RepID=UPI00301684D8